MKGGCPHCGEPSGGNACEACGRPNHCGDLADPHCVVCGAAGELREIERLFLPLARFEDELVAFWDAVRMPPHLRALCEVMRAEGLPEIAVTQPGDWGIPRAGRRLRRPADLRLVRDGARLPASRRAAARRRPASPPATG